MPKDAKSQNPIMQVTVGSVAMTNHADFSSETTNELLYGETIEIIGTREDEYGAPWVEAVSLHDGYQGFIAQDALGATVENPTHKVYALRSFVYPEPDFKTLPILALSFGSLVHAKKDEHNGFVRLSNSGWIWSEHLIESSYKVLDYSATAERFIGTPYLWGGRTSFGLDCSALVQLALQAAGYKPLRDSKDQETSLTSLPKNTTLTRGDLVYFKGHVGIMVSESRILNASARTMDTRVERLSDLARFYKGIVSVKRP